MFIKITLFNDKIHLALFIVTVDVEHCLKHRFVLRYSNNASEYVLNILDQKKHKIFGVNKSIVRSKRSIVSEFP